MTDSAYFYKTSLFRTRKLVNSLVQKCDKYQAVTVEATRQTLSPILATVVAVEKLLVLYTVMHRLTTEICSEKCVVRRFRRRTNVIERSYT